jgi:tetratricopeptide (TPR) repeat protein
MTSLRKIPIVSALALVLVAAQARGDDATELERAKASYDAGRYAEGVERFKEILNPKAPNALHDPAAIERARAYYAACLIALGRSDEADAEIEKVIRYNPLYSPDPVIFPGKVVDRFIEVRGRLKPVIEAKQRADAEAARAAREAREKAEREQRAYIETLQRLAAQESVVVRRSRWIAAVPFGAGQFQNGQENLGYAFLVSESLLAATSLTAGVIHMQLIADYAKYQNTVDFADYDARRQTSQTVSLLAGGALAAVAIGGIVHAELTFVPEVRETRPRPIPKPPAVTPTVIPGNRGLVVGLVGWF